MSINIDKEDFREAIDLLEIVKCLPLEYFTSGTSTVTYDGEYITVANSAGAYSAIGTGYGSPAYGAGKADKSLLVQGTVKAVTTDTSCYFFFLEPRKADYGEFQGFKTDAGAGTHKFEFRSGGTEEEDAIAGQDWTADRLFMIKHRAGYFDINFNTEGAAGTPITVAHGLLNDGAGVTPTAVIPIAQADAGDVWVDTVGAANFNINYDGGGAVAFFWLALYKATPLCEGYIDGVLKASCTDAADISLGPLCVYCAEPNAVARSMTLLYPPGIHMGAG